jgi:hypothetical protein
VKEKYIQMIGIVVTGVYFVIIVFIYASEPRTLGEISSKASSTLDNAATKGQVLIGTYEVDKAEFGRGLSEFRADNFIAARDSLRRADPEKRDANTQFYIAYSYYRQGWGRISNDDELFRQGLEQLSTVDVIDPNFRSTDDNLKLKTTAELRHEFDEGLKITASDFDPRKLMRERY